MSMFYKSEYIEIYHCKGYNTSDICRHKYDDVDDGVNTFDPLAVFDYFKEIKQSASDNTIVRVDFIADDEVNEDFVKLWLICERVTGFNIFKVNCPCNLARTFEDCRLTTEDYKWAFTVYEKQFKELID